AASGGADVVRDCTVEETDAARVGKGSGTCRRRPHEIAVDLVGALDDALDVDADAGVARDDVARAGWLPPDGVPVGLGDEDAGAVRPRLGAGGVSADVVALHLVRLRRRVPQADADDVARDQVAASPVRARGAYDGRGGAEGDAHAGLAVLDDGAVAAEADDVALHRVAGGAGGLHGDAVGVPRDHVPRALARP